MMELMDMSLKLNNISTPTPVFPSRFLSISTGSGFGISPSSRLSSSVSAMRVLNTGSDVEEALADALVHTHTHSLTQSYTPNTD